MYWGKPRTDSFCASFERANTKFISEKEIDILNHLDIACRVEVIKKEVNGR